ncbi:MAG: type II toxin-antitoxin system VapC family toxin [Acidobacteriota bacterium]|nr:type II toxin-antitoxin system VapC family toxin [Acidobacteriota bacterium]
MAEFVLDASVAISWCFPDDPTEDTAYSRRILAELAVRHAIVPEVWAFEIANTIFVSFSKRKRITERQIGGYLTRLHALPIRVEPNDLWANIALESRARKWLELAARKHLPLATADHRLRKAAFAERIDVLR